MYTQCPQCQACFEVTAEQLKIGDGDVRCGQCLSIFNALHYLSESLPAPDAAPTAPEHIEPSIGDIDNLAAEFTAQNTPPTEATCDPGDADDLTRQQIDAIQFPTDALPADTDAAVADHSPATNTEASGEPLDTESAEAALDETKTPAEPAQPAAAREIYAEPIIDAEANTAAGEPPNTHLPAPLMRQLQEEKAASLRPPSTPWVIGSLLMVVLFVAQGSYFYRDTLAQRQPELRPWLEMACGYLDDYLDCHIQRPPSMARIDILGWDVRTLANTPQALIASTTLINNNPKPQPYPLLTLRFSDINGRPLAQRRFLPREYLPADTDISAGMTPDTPVIVELALVDPGKQAVNFEFHTDPVSTPER